MIRTKGVFGCAGLIVPIMVSAVMPASLEQLVCAGTDVVVAEIVSGHGVESGYGRDCNLTLPIADSCDMVKLTIKVDAVLGERYQAHNEGASLAPFVVTQTMDVIAYVGEVLPSPITDEDLQAASAAQGASSDAAVMKLITGSHFIFSFDRTNPYPPGVVQFFSHVFRLGLRSSVQVILLNGGGGIPSCPKPVAP